jgi:hypothetical protein
MTPQELKQYAKTKQEFIEKSLSSLDADINKLQRRLFSELSDKLLSKMASENGKLIQNVPNFQAVNNLEQLMREFSQQFVTPVIRSLADNMLKTIALTDKAFKDGYNVSDAQIKSMQEQSKWVLTSIGIKPNGDIIAGGYLSKLAEMPEVQTKLRDYISSNVINSAGLSEFQKGFKTLIEGTPDIPGEIAKYHQQFSYDLFNQADSAVTKVYAEEQGFKYFLYYGSIIDTSRCFCRKRAGKVFSYEDTKKWLDDPTLIKYYQDHPYDPIIMRGGFNCRHSIEPVSDEMAKRMGYDKSNADAIVDEECD